MGLYPSGKKGMSLGKAASNFKERAPSLLLHAIYMLTLPMTLLETTLTLIDFLVSLVKVPRYRSLSLSVTLTSRVSELEGS